MTDQPAYTDVDKLKVLATLADNGGDIFQTYVETGVPYGTLLKWSKEQNVTLDSRLIKAAHQLLAALPDKLDDADLQEVTRALSVVLEKIKDTEEEDQRGVYEKLAQLMDRFAAAKRPAGASLPVDEGER